MRVRRDSLPFLAALLALFQVPLSASASVVTYMDTRTLTGLSPVIVLGQVRSVVPVENASGGIFTDVTLDVSEALRGPRDLASLRVRLLGGRVGSREAVVFGTPRFEMGEEVLVFATPAKAGWLTVTGLFQGKIQIERENGEAFAVRARPEDQAGVAIVPRGLPEDTRVPLEAFLARVRGLASEVRPAKALELAAAEAARATAVAPPDVPQFTLLPLPFRRFEPDSGQPLVYRFNPANAPSIPDAGGPRQAFLNALEAWSTVPGQSLRLVDGGDTTARCYLTFDGISGISHGDPCGEVPAFDPGSCSGVLAIGGLSEIAGETRFVNGQLFFRGLQGDVVINSDTDCFFAGPGHYEEVLAHEIGHTFGLGHSCGDSRSPDCSTSRELAKAQMRAFAHGDGRGADPRRDDIKGARFLYPPQAFAGLNLNDSSMVTGERALLTLDLNGTATADLWFLTILPGLAPRTSRALSSFPLTFVADLVLLDHQFTGTEPSGTYLFAVALTVPGGPPTEPANILSLAWATFTYAP
ncbi:MAG TPA: M12 family metallo-peptidase [Vicinamibacteria bacterium]